MTYYFYQKLQKEARERYQIFLKKKQTIGEKSPGYQSLTKKENHNKDFSEEQTLVEYKRNYYLTHNK